MKYKTTGTDQKEMNNDHKETELHSIKIQPHKNNRTAEKTQSFDQTETQKLQQRYNTNY